MAIATLTVQLKQWTAHITNASSETSAGLMRHFSSEGPVAELDQLVLGKPVRDIVINVQARALEAEYKFPLGYVWLSEDILVAELLPGEIVFSELWTRNVYGGAMPKAVQISVQGDGETWRRDISWDGKNPDRLPIVNLRFSI